jgi:polyisoprenyl-teichoic acid--peptidoglycan teichoic acid transferase
MRVSPLGALLVVFLGLVFTVAASLFAYNGVRQAIIQSPIELPAPPQVGAARPTPIPVVAAATSIPTAIAVAGGPTTTAPIAATADASNNVPMWSDPKRVTVLLLGIDQRPQEAGPFRTDTLILLSLDPITKTGVMLSIPRDVYTKIPGFAAPISPNRINTANFIGDSQEYPGGGPALAVKTVEGLLGIPIDRYVMVNFKAFNLVVEALGPVTVCPTERIFDASYPDTDTYGVITVEFQPGCQALDAVKLLQYARVRHNAGDDFGRAQRQQEVIRAVKDKALSLGGISALLGQALPLWEALAGNIRTDFTFDELVQLASLAQDVTDIRSAVLNIRSGGQGELLTSTLPSGEQVLVPYYDGIIQLTGSLFATTASLAADTRASNENAVLFIANGSTQDGLAAKTAERLRGLGFNISGVGNAEARGMYGRSEIKVYTGKIQTARYLAEALGLVDPLITDEANGPAGVDIQLIIGADLTGQ